MTKFLHWKKNLTRGTGPKPSFNPPKYGGKKLSPALKKNWAEPPLDKLFLTFICPHSPFLSRPTGQDCPS